MKEKEAPKELEPYEKAANEIAKENNTDVILFVGPITRVSAKTLIGICNETNRRKNVLLIMETYGGNADAGYQIARCLQDKYENFAIFIRGMCKSSGTLIALGANELIMNDNGELGPLDVQMSKKDELWESQSGHIVGTAIDYLQNRAFNSFADFFRKIIAGDFGNISLKTAANLASELTRGLYGPIFEQVDPMHAGEAGRATLIAYHYGTRLVEKSKICEMDVLGQLIYNYPSHGFVIDRDESKDLFKKVRKPSGNESNLSACLPEFDLSRNLILLLSTSHNDNSMEEKVRKNDTREKSDEVDNGATEQDS